MFSSKYDFYNRREWRRWGDRPSLQRSTSLPHRAAIPHHRRRLRSPPTLTPRSRSAQRLHSTRRRRHDPPRPVRVFLAAIYAFACLSDVAAALMTDSSPAGWPARLLAAPEFRTSWRRSCRSLNSAAALCRGGGCFCAASYVLRSRCAVGGLIGRWRWLGTGLRRNSRLLEGFSGLLCWFVRGGEGWVEEGVVGRGVSPPTLPAFVIDPCSFFSLGP